MKICTALLNNNNKFSLFRAFQSGWYRRPNTEGRIYQKTSGQKRLNLSKNVRPKMTIRLNLPKISYYYIQLKTGLTERLVILTESISSNLNFYVTKHKFWYIRCITAINTFWPYDNFRPYGIDYLVFWLLFIWPSDFGHLTPPYFNLNTSLFWQK